jgi:DNA-binding response OmpR family regulator
VSAGTGGQQRVLVVDDEPALRALLADFLGRRGLAVREAAVGLAMRAALAAEPADVVVLDVTMPGESGLDLLAELRARGDDVPVVLLTACDGLDDRLAGLGRGADDYVTKPFEPR